MSGIIVQQNIGDISGLSLVETKQFLDNRGFFTETYNEKVFFENGLTHHFIQDNEVHNRMGVLRGFHFNQIRPQAKLVRVLSGKIFDVVIDMRKNSATLKKNFWIELSGDNRLQLYIPEGFAHAYLALTDAVVLFKVTTHYIPGDEIGFAWNSKEFGIPWPKLAMGYVLNEKDRLNPDYSKIIC